MNDLQFKHIIDGNAGNEIVFRTGSALPPLQPQRLTIDGDIKAPGDFFTARKGLPTAAPASSYFPLEKTIVTVNWQTKCIVLTCDENSPVGTVVTGTLKTSPEVLTLGINSGKPYSAGDLATTLSKVKYLFESKDEALQIISALKNFKGSISSNVENSKDERGNKRNLLDVSVTTNVPVSFKMSLPVFQNFAPETVNVEIVLDSRGHTVDIYLESDEIRKITDETGDKILAEQLDIFRAEGITVVSIS